MNERKATTRRDLLRGITQLQQIIGEAMAQDNDRNPNRKHNVDAALEAAHELCIKLRAGDPPIAVEPAKIPGLLATPNGGAFEGRATHPPGAGEEKSG